VDWLASKVIGDVTRRHLAELTPALRAWAKDETFWVSRTALLAQVDELRAGRGDFALFAELATPMLSEKEFFIRKALGWVLRETTRKQPQLAFAFLLQHRGEVSGLTLREGAKHLPDPLRARLGLASLR
jgi:3-methyladenine DNA glycosylase AlkD